VAVTNANHTSKTSPENGTLVAVWSAFKGTVQATNKLVPGVVTASLVLAFWVIWATISTGVPLIGAAALLVLLISITVYGKTNSYGEAALSLIGGLLTVFSVNWTPAYFWIFTGVLVGFSLSALLISSSNLRQTLRIFTSMRQCHCPMTPMKWNALKRSLKQSAKSIQLKGP
jgi:hypothetical protein